MDWTTLAGEDPSAFMEAVRSVLREQRLRARRSQADVARAVSSSRKRISDFELGLGDPGFGFVAALAVELGTPLSLGAPADPFEARRSLSVDNTQAEVI
jgi:transcriptional regulator with XRE-family HTH domain